MPTPVTMERQALRGTAILKRRVECRCCQMGAVLSGDTVSNHPTGKQFQNHAEVEGVVLNLEIGDVADPDFIYPGCPKILVEQVSFLILLPLFEVTLRVFPDTDRIQFSHDFPDALFADMNTAFGQHYPDFFCAIPLLAIVKNLPLLFQIPCAICLAGNMVVEGSSRYFQCLAQLVNAVLRKLLIKPGQNF